MMGYVKLVVATVQTRLIEKIDAEDVPEADDLSDPYSEGNI